MSDNVSLKTQKESVSNKKFVMKVFTCADHRNQYTEQKLCIMLVQDADGIAELDEMEMKELHPVCSKQFLWGQPRGSKVYVRLTSGDFSAQKELSVSRIMQFKYPEKLIFRLLSNATKFTVDIDVSNEHEQLCEKKGLQFHPFPPKETRAAMEHPSS